MTKEKGFTLIELLVVIAIIGLLATIVSANLVTARAKARDAKRIADIRTIQLALETYFNDNSQYPLTIYGASGLAPTYLPFVPTDPLAASGTSCSGASVTGCYDYVAIGLTPTSATCNSSNPPVRYHLGATLERLDNSALGQDVDAAAQTACNGSGVSDFSGLSTASNSSGQLCSSGTAGTAGPNGTETCYDVTN